jgi:hypothetical protein
MANQGFGGCIIIRPSEGLTINLPSRCIAAQGRIKKPILARLNDLNTDNLEYLNRHHVSVIKASDTVVEIS